jgi:hypothetical protein
MFRRPIENALAKRLAPLLVLPFGLIFLGGLSSPRFGGILMLLLVVVFLVAVARRVKARWFSGPR